MIFALFQIVAAFSSRYAHTVERLLGLKVTIGMLLFLVAGGYLLMGNIIVIASFAFCLIGQFVRGISTPVMEDVIHGLTTSDMRATILSAQSFVGRLVYALIIPILGWVTDAYTLTQAITALGITTLLIGIFFLVVFRRIKII